MTTAIDPLPMTTSEDDPPQVVLNDGTPPSVTIISPMMADLALSVPLPSPCVPPESTKPTLFKPASIYARRAACTHINMERLYGMHPCSICQRPSPMGWVYSCIQDKGSLSIKEETPNQTLNLYIEDLINQIPTPEPNANQERTAEEMAAELLGPYITLVRLSPWIEKAILEGHYTPTQVAKMRAQRGRALGAIAAADNHVKAHPEHSADHPSTPIMSSESVTLALNQGVPTTKETSDSALLDSVFKPSQKPRMFPHCHFRACQSCRPTFRDRAWIRFEEIFTQNAPFPLIDFATDPRPLASKNTIRRLGLRVYESPIPSHHIPQHILQQHGLRLLNPLQLSGGSLPCRLPPGLFTTEDLTDQKTEIGSKGFRESMRRAFRGMLDRRRDSFPSRSNRKRGTRDGRNESEFDMDLFQQLNDELLQEASGVPLPGHDGMDGLADEQGEVEVEEGVAVTEEGIDLGTADIIMSV